jgi:hypothetical protein
MKKCASLLLIILFCSFGSNAQIITTIAGGGATVPGDGGAATDCGLNGPIGVAVDAAGNIYIGERDNNRVRKVTPAGIVTTIGGGTSLGYDGDNGPATDAKMEGPAGIAVDVMGNVYFSDVGNNCVRKINTAGIITTVAGNGTIGFSGDNGPATAAQMYQPEGVAVDHAGNLYISDYLNDRIRKVSTSGIITTVAGTGLEYHHGDGGPATAANIHHPSGIFVDAANNIFIGEDGGSCVRKVDVSGIISTIAGTGVSGYNGDYGIATNIMLYRASGVAVDYQGNVYIGDIINQRIRMVSTSGYMSTICGNGMPAFSGDGGPAIAAEIAGPAYIALDAASNIYFADFNNNRIRKIQSTLSISDIHTSDFSLNVYPNPVVDEHCTIYVSSASDELLNILITNVVGEKIQKIEARANEPLLLHLDLPPGMYIITAVGPYNTLSKKINVIR